MASIPSLSCFPLRFLCNTHSHLFLIFHPPNVANQKAIMFPKCHATVTKTPPQHQTQKKKNHHTTFQENIGGMFSLALGDFTVLLLLATPTKAMAAAPILHPLMVINL